jgi:excisionase family DNA binding protein
MTTTETRCQRCGYRTGRCECPQGPLREQPLAPAPATSQAPELMTPAEVAAVFRVDPKTVTRWAQQGKLRSLRTLGGHRRFAAADIRALLNEDQR